MNGINRHLVSSFYLLILSIWGVEGMNPSFKGQLTQWRNDNMPTPTPSKDIEKKPVKQQQQEKQSEELSERDLKYLMGTSRPTYRRHKGALRQK
jgi:hypothetical protein